MTPEWKPHEMPSRYARFEGVRPHAFALRERGRGVHWKELSRQFVGGWDYFWSRPHRSHLTPPSTSAQ